LLHVAADNSNKKNEKLDWDTLCDI
jgi:hypothetical protein